MTYFDPYTREELTDSDLDTRYADSLDSSGETVTVAGLSFDPSTVLRECDPIAYRSYFADWLDAELRDGSIVEELEDDEDDDDDEDEDYERTSCAVCGLDIEGHPGHGIYWDRGGNRHGSDGHEHNPATDSEL